MHVITEAQQEFVDIVDGVLRRYSVTRNDREVKLFEARYRVNPEYSTGLIAVGNVLFTRSEWPDTEEKDDSIVNRERSISLGGIGIDRIISANLVLYENDNLSGFTFGGDVDEVIPSDAAEANCLHVATGVIDLLHNDALVLER